jgi:hypothetical protein
MTLAKEPLPFAFVEGDFRVMPFRWIAGVCIFARPWPYLSRYIPFDDIHLYSSFVPTS